MKFPVQVKINSKIVVMQAIVLAAGFGTRLRPYTNLRPKPLFPVANQMLLHRLLDQLAACECWPVVVNAHYLPEQIEAALDGYPNVELQVEPEILGTGGALRKALDSMNNEPILVMNGDLYHEINPEWVYHRHLLSKNDVTMALHDYPRFNTVQVGGDRVLGFAEAAQTNCLAFTGIHVVDPEVLERIAVGTFHHIIDLYQELAREDRIGYCRTDSAFWYDIGTPVDYLQLHGRLLEPVGDWEIASTAQVAPDAHLSGWGCIGENAAIGAGAVLHNCVVWSGAQVPKGAMAEGAIITGDTAVDSQLQDEDIA
ncbi:NTP transferase domain-containing protein [Desulfobulbus rhabdoformis]|uniref:sugar phosphate nucleotidyltransferase n=1 Tax=Desulfobulbus rhabdoformis TaxID=34032 RepID=UPI0019624E0F|nr:NTP transferase domain-containing protein [Desulfobulbus rhabdoformis]